VVRHARGGALEGTEKVATIVDIPRMNYMADHVNNTGIHFCADTWVELHQRGDEL
jgi:hypothetical protein